MLQITDVIWRMEVQRRAFLSAKISQLDPLLVSILIGLPYAGHSWKYVFHIERVHSRFTHQPTRLK